MRTIYLVRHGQTLFNLHHKIQGTCDSPLTSMGIAQAEAVQKYFTKNHISFDAAFCSVQQRASDTLELITDNKIKYSRLRDLREKSHGEYEGQDEFMLPWRRGYSRINSAMEPDEHVKERMESAITQIIDRTKDSDTILVVGHGTALRLYVRSINSDFKKFDNCGIVKLQATDDQIEYVDYVAPAKDVKSGDLNTESVLKFVNVR